MSQKRTGCWPSRKSLVAELRITQRLVALLLCLGTSASFPSFAQEQKSAPEFSYSGANRPEAWGDLSPAYAECKLGHLQSPIDIRGTKKEALPPIEFHYNEAPLKIIDNGHSIEVDYAPGSWIMVGDKRYQLRQFHFHHPSEEHLYGKGYDMSLHLVHASSEKRLAVVTVLLKTGNANGTIQGIWDHLPRTKGHEDEVSGVTINAAALLPQTTGYYTFQGSLTTPPCTEGVAWFILKTPMQLSSGQLTVFAKLYPNDARPIQATEHRAILESQF